MQLQTLESPRLCFKQMEARDFHFLLSYHSDPVLTRYLPLGAPYPKDKVREYLENRIAHWIQHRFGTFLISLKSTDRVIGYCGLEYVKDTGFVDIRYGVVRNMWGQGIAREAAQRCLDYGFNQLNLATIYGAAEPDNVPSLMVLNRIGMKPCEEVDFYGDVVTYFKITKPG